MSKQLPMSSEMVIRKRKPCLRRPPLWLVLAVSLAAGVCLGTQAQAQQMQMPGAGPSSQMPGAGYPSQMPGAGYPSQMPGARSPSHLPQMRIPGANGPDRAFHERQIKALNSQRQKKLVSDTDKLLKLTTALNAQIGNEQAGSFTPKELRMLAQIEKLAKSVKRKMSDPIQLPNFRNDFPPAIAPASIP